MHLDLNTVTEVVRRPSERPGGDWRPGDAFPTGSVAAAASGAAFLAVVAGQSANAFACRSTTRSPAAMGWTTNRLLLPAVLIELAFAIAVIVIPPVADELGQAPPPLAGWAMALLAAAAVLAVDHIDKRLRRARTDR